MPRNSNILAPIQASVLSKTGHHFSTNLRTTALRATAENAINFVVPTDSTKNISTTLDLV